MPETQALTLAANLPAPTRAGKDGKPKVIIPSALELTLAQEERLLLHAHQRFTALQQELGRADYESPGWMGQAVDVLQRNGASHLGKRHLAHLIYQQQMDWRRYMLGGLYAESNVHLPITARIVGQQTARANKSFFGTSPWFAVSGLSADSEVLAEDVNAWARHQLDTLGGLQTSLEAAIELAFIQGECAVKTRHHKLSSYFESWREVAIDPATKQPFVAEDGDYIYKTDLFRMDEALGVMVLVRDGKTPQPAPDMAPLFKTVKIHLTRLLHDKVESRPIYYLDFLCPLTATDVQTADSVFHLYNAQVIEMADRYLRDKWGDTPPKDQLERIADLVAQILPGTPEDRQALADRSRPEQGELTQSGGVGRDRNEPTVGLAEGWHWYDVFGDGVQRSIILLMDQSGKVPVYYDYADNVTDDGLRPIDIVRINPVTGRWHGQGNVERLYSLQDQADLLLNRALFAESRAARVDFWDPSRTVEGAADPNLKMNWGGTYRLIPGERMENVLQSSYLTNIKAANLKDLLEIILQMAQNISAVTNVNDGAMAGMDTAKLATGIKNLERSGEEMFHQYMSHLGACIEPIVRRALKLLLGLLRNVSEKEKLARFFDRISQRLVELDTTRLQDLDLDIKLELTTYKSQAQLQQAQMGYNMAVDYLTRPPVIQVRLQGLVRQFFRALEIKDADKIAMPLTDMEYAMSLPAPAAGLPTVPGGEQPAASMI